ncbi:class I SAM-dependent methyltransferase [Streptomonospora sediminis]
MTLIPESVFDTAYANNAAPWVIGEPQPEIMALERDGWISGAVLDPGCGTGEHAIFLARLGYNVRGIDFSERAVNLARANAADNGVEVEFEVADALSLADQGRSYDTVIDSALFHVFEGTNRTDYVASLHAACRPGGLVHVLALSDAEPGIGPRISDTAIREAFGAGWELEELRASRYRCVVTGESEAAYFNRKPGESVDQVAWSARIRRL